LARLSSTSTVRRAGWWSKSMATRTRVGRRTTLHAPPGCRRIWPVSLCDSRTTTFGATWRRWWRRYANLCAGPPPPPPRWP
jgi:hypothetical protein